MARVLFGLGNPGRAYAATRHNAGFQTLDLLADRQGAAFRGTRLLDGEVADAVLGPARVRLVKPRSFMNLCGPVYARALSVYEVEPADALVVVDDFMLPFGRLRLRAEGSSGGHNGLRSIEGALGSRAYPRLRLGIGPCPEGRDPADWVLERYGAEERRRLPDLLERASAAAACWAAEGIEAAMRAWNGSGEAPEPGEAPTA